jgi:uncharacterized phage protein gp47/JayE
MAVEDLIETKSQADLFEQFAADAATLEYPVDVRGMQPERVGHAWLQVESKSHEQYQIRRRDIVNSGWLRTAKGDSLTLVARGFFQLERYPATQAVQRIRFQDVGGVGPVNVAAGERVPFANNGQEFRNIAGFTIPLNGFIDVDCKAEVAGSLGNADSGTITRQRAPIVGVSVSNPAISGQANALVTAGRDVETDGQLATRCEDRWGSVGAGGNAAAYRFWVTESFDVDGLVATITRIKILDANPYGPGSIGVVIANASGTATVGELTRVGGYLATRKALGSGQLLTSSATAQVQLISGTIFVEPGYVFSEVEAAVQAALDTYESEFAISGTVYRSEIVQRAMAVDGVYNFQLADPPTDITIGNTAIVSFTYAFSQG